MTLGNKNDPMESIIIDDHEVKPTNCLKLLGVSIDNNLRFDEHISITCKKSSQRVGVLMRLKNLISTVLSCNCLKLPFFHILITVTLSGISGNTNQ